MIETAQDAIWWFTVVAQKHGARPETIQHAEQLLYSLIRSQEPLQTANRSRAKEAAELRAELRRLVSVAMAAGSTRGEAVTAVAERKWLSRSTVYRALAGELSNSLRPSACDDQLIKGDSDERRIAE